MVARKPQRGSNATPWTKLLCSENIHSLWPTELLSQTPYIILCHSTYLNVVFVLTLQDEQSMSDTKYSFMLFYGTSALFKLEVTRLIDWLLYDTSAQKGY